MTLTHAAAILFALAGLFTAIAAVFYWCAAHLGSKRLREMSNYLAQK